MIVAKKLEFFNRNEGQGIDYQFDDFLGFRMY